MGNIYFDVGTEYYSRPIGRSRTDGAHSGERFREDFLVHMLSRLKDNEKLVLDFDNVTMAGSSFLEEAFGGLVRTKRYTADDLLKRIEIKVDPDLKELFTDRIVQYIKDAGSRK